MTIDSGKLSLTARWIFPVSGPPIERGVLELEDGRVVDVHGRHGPHAIDLGNVALIPGLVNAHTHLEFSDLAQPVQPALPFTAWIRSLVGVRRSHPATSLVIQQGLAESKAAGTTSLGDIATQSWSAADYAAPGQAVIAFRELIGLRPDRARDQLAIARNWLEQPAPGSGAHTWGLSPHAPYSVHPQLYHDLIQLAAEYQAPVAVHLAETQSELELLERGTGEFVEMLQRFNAWDEQAIPRGSRPLDYLLPLECLSRALVIHGNYLNREEMDWLADKSQISVVYCPRTHAFFQHTAHPWEQLQERQINVALGTDSRGSNPDLSLWGELQFLARQYPNRNPATLLAMGTIDGARALGLTDCTGSLEPGKRADVALVNLEGVTETDPYRALFSTPHGAQTVTFPGCQLRIEPNSD